MMPPGVPFRRNICVSDRCPPLMAKRDVWNIDQFSLGKKIGSGYASVVRAARCDISGKPVAIKMYIKSKLSDLNHFQVFREIRIHSGLSHKHIILLYAAFEDEHGIYLVMEYASEGDVFTHMERRGGRLNEAEAVRMIMHPFLSCLLYLHGKNIIHRDIKPENILLTSTGVLKVADYGLSINCEEESPVTRVGTLDYMAPEVVSCPDKRDPYENKEMSKLRYTPAVDTWSTGVLAYELICGRPPFDCGHKKATIAHILQHTPEMPQSLSSGCHHFILWALTKRADRRPAVKDLVQHPWITGYLWVPKPAPSRPVARGASFIEYPPPALMAQPLLSPKDLKEAVGVTSMQHSTAMLRSLSVNFSSQLRWRDVAFEATTGESNFGRGGCNYDHVPMPLRISDSADIDSPSRRASAQSMLTPRSPGLSRMNSFLRGPSSSSTACSSPRTREELMADLRRPISCPRSGVSLSALSGFNGWGSLSVAASPTAECISSPMFAFPSISGGPVRTPPSRLSSAVLPSKVGNSYMAIGRGQNMSQTNLTVPLTKILTPSSTMPRSNTSPVCLGSTSKLPSSNLHTESSFVMNSISDAYSELREQGALADKFSIMSMKSEGPERSSVAQVTLIPEGSEPSTTCSHEEYSGGLESSNTGSLSQNRCNRKSSEPTHEMATYKAKDKLIYVKEWLGSSWKKVFFKGKKPQA